MLIACPELAAPAGSDLLYFPTMHGGEWIPWFMQAGATETPVWQTVAYQIKQDALINRPGRFVFITIGQDGLLAYHDAFVPETRVVVDRVTMALAVPVLAHYRRYGLPQFPPQMPLADFLRGDYGTV